MTAVAGCLQPASTECPGGGLCPSGLACLTLDGQERCVLPTCGDGQLDQGEACDDGNHISTDGCRYDCQISCGDGDLDPFEVCDDGNQLGGDGCAADCASDERCGNQRVDSAAGESCDDGNGRSADGCSSTCELETPRWQVAGLGPSPRVGHALAYDAIRDRVVLFGGCAANDDTCAGGLLDDTWEWDGTAWTRKVTDGAPAPRSAHAMAFDAARGTVVLFGGCSQWQVAAQPYCLGPLGDTWEWDGEAWARRQPTTSPTARSEHALAFDAARRQIVLFGGREAMPETWMWNGDTWTRSEGMVGSFPPPRERHAMAFDARRGQVVMFGGSTYGGPTRNDLWLWDGAGWTQLTTSVAPPARAAHAMAYDADRQVIVVVGGCKAYDLQRQWDPRACLAAAGDRWEWDGSSWTQAAVADAPVTVMRHALAYDLRRRTLVMFGGLEGAAYVDTTRELTEVWRVAATATAAVPVGRWSVAMTYDLRRGKVVMFGGDGFGGVQFNDTWEWDGAWRLRPTIGAPTPRRGASIAYDVARERVVLFGGDGTQADPDNGTQTWELDDTGWIRRTPTARPSARSDAALAYDPRRRRTVLFGGQLQGTSLDDTWEWDGTTWTQLTPSTRPPPRFGAKLVFDAQRQTLVLFGGPDQSGTFDVLWEWDGANWTRRPTDAGPGWEGGAVAYDPVRAANVMFGGARETWEWSGTVWRELATATSPPARGNHGLAYDPRRARLVLFGGTTAMSVWNDTWILGHHTSAPVEACGAGFDADGDGDIGCDDADCLAVCDPWCLSLGVCAGARPHCGNGTCDPLESCRSCPADCAACPAVCGDFHCDPGEDTATCRSDCP